MNGFSKKIRHILDLPKYKRLIKYFWNKCRGILKDKKILVFKGWSIDFPNIQFIYNTNNKDYYANVTLNCLNKDEFESIKSDLSDLLLSLLGLSFLPRFFALDDFSIIKSDIPINKDIAEFFELSIPKCLAEFRYREGLDPMRPVKFKYVDNNCNKPLAENIYFKEKLLVLNGGGKDTVVMIEICKKLGIDLAWFSVNLKNSQKKISAVSGINLQYDIEFKIDKYLYIDKKFVIYSLPSLMSYNFLALFPAVVHGYSYIASGNEVSSNYGNVLYKGVEINHQYGKSFEFELLFDNLVKKHISSSLRNFSILRPFHDVQLAKYFTQHPEYFCSILSCNVNPQNWCKKCAKCAFTYIALMPFIEMDNMKKIFGDDFLQDPDIRREIIELTSRSLKPWECVGTQDECKLVLLMILEKYPDLDFANWPKRVDLEKCCAGFDIDMAVKNYLEYYNEQNLIPDHFQQIIRQNYLVS